MLVTSDTLVPVVFWIWFDSIVNGVKTGGTIIGSWVYLILWAEVISILISGNFYDHKYRTMRSTTASRWIIVQSWCSNLLTALWRVTTLNDRFMLEVNSNGEKDLWFHSCKLTQLKIAAEKYVVCGLFKSVASAHVSWMQLTRRTSLVSENNIRFR